MPKEQNIPELDTETILTARQIKVINFIAAAPTILEGCKQAGISRAIFYKWMSGPAFKTALVQRQSEVADLSLKELRLSVSNACEVLRDLLSSPNAMIRRLAANDILNHVSRDREVAEITDRIESIEQYLIQRVTYK